MKRIEQAVILALAAVLLVSGLAFRQKMDELKRQVEELQQRQLELENSLQEDKPTTSETVLTAQEDEEIAEPEPRYILNDADRELIERVVMAESGNQPFEGQVAVASCIYNTAVAKGTSPAAVVQAKGQYARPYGGEVTESVKQAVSVVFDEDRPVEGICYFYSTVGGFVSRWHETALVFDRQIADHKFFKVG